MKITNPEESIAKALKRFAREQGIIGKFVQLEGIFEQIKINTSTISESISSMTKQQSDLLNLSKLLTVLEKVAENAILIEVEKFRHVSKTQKAADVLGEFQYVSAFYDTNVLYPVKITAERRKNYKDTNVHLIITVGTIPIRDLQKEGFSIPGVHPSHSGRESLDSGRNPSFDIILPRLVKYFNENEAILIKNLPNQMLSEKQQEIKEKLVRFDKEKEIAKRMERFRSTIVEAAERGESIVHKVVPHEYSEQMRQTMLKSGICFLPLTNDDGYLDIVVLEKDKDAFLQVQSAVFQKEKESECAKTLQKEKNSQELESEEIER